MAKEKNLESGDRTPKSGQYPVIGPRGDKTGREVTSVEGRPLPPTQKPGEGHGKPDVIKRKKPWSFRSGAGMQDSVPSEGGQR